MSATKTRILIMGAAGRDFHNFNCLYRDNEKFEVVAFTATQIPGIGGRKYPASLAGKLYPDGIPIYEETELSRLIKELNVDTVLFSYSDISHQELMQKGSAVIAAGVQFAIAGGDQTMVKSNKPLVAVCAARTGCGKSQTSRKVVKTLTDLGLRVVAIRHPMPYGNLGEQAVQHFSTRADLDKHKCTIEEREEYEPYIDNGAVVLAGVDYHEIIAQAEHEADVIIWDGGNNDMPFYKPDLMFTVVDPHRAGDEETYYPGLANLIMADVVIINKIETAEPEGIETVRRNIAKHNPEAMVIDAASPVSVEYPDAIKGKRVLIIEDGPTLTHGEMAYGAGFVAARKYGAAEIVSPVPYLKGSLIDTLEKYSHQKNVLPAMGYSPEQIGDMQETIEAAAKSGAIDSILIATPIDLGRVLEMPKGVEAVRVRYELQEIGHPNLASVLRKFHSERFSETPHDELLHFSG